MAWLHADLPEIDNQRAFWMLTGWQAASVPVALAAILYARSRRLFVLQCMIVAQIYVLVPLACRPPNAEPPWLLLPSRLLVGDARFGLAMACLSLALGPAALSGSPPVRWLGLCLLLWPGNLSALQRGDMPLAPALGGLLWLGARQLRR